jgi:hypothetical protein
MSAMLRRVQDSLVVMKKFAVGWALIGGMVVYTLLVGAKQLARRLQNDGSATGSSEEPAAARAESHRFTGSEPSPRTQSD